MSKHLSNRHYDKYTLSNINYLKIICIDNDSKKYIEDNSNEIPINLNNLIYINIYYNKNPEILVTTPVMVCPFGFETKNNNFNIKLQFTNYKTDINMKNFLDFIRNIEFNNMKYIGITEDNVDLYNSQIYDTNKKYDPLLQVKVPFLHNRFNVEVYNDNYNLNISSINKYSKVKCDIYIDKIWFYNQRYICKWKLKKIYIL